MRGENMNIETKGYPKPEIPPKEYWEDEKWADDNYTELVKKYPNMWITVVDKKVFAASSDPKEIISKTEFETGKKEFPIIFVEKGVHVY
jgi:hypothetical protein